MPAVCERCGRTFTSGIVVGGSASVTLHNNRAGPCPYCLAKGRRSMGSVVEGRFDIVDGTIQAIRASPWTADTLRRLGMLLEDARDQNLPATQVAQKVEAEMPELAPVAAVLRGRRVDLKWWLMFVLAIIAILVAHLDAASAPSATDMEHGLSKPCARSAALALRHRQLMSAHAT